MKNKLNVIIHFPVIINSNYLQLKQLHEINFEYLIHEKHTI